MMVKKRQSQNDMDEDFVEYIEEEYEDDFEVEPPMHEIKNEEDRTFTKPRGFEKKTVDFSKRGSKGFGKKRERGLPRHAKQGPINRTRGKSPFTYKSGLSLQRTRSKVVGECEPEENLVSHGAFLGNDS